MRADNQIKNNSDCDIELKQFYFTSLSYLKRLEKHDEKTFASYIDLCKTKILHRGSILDCGCGIGTSSHLLAKEGFNVTAMDISPLFISVAKKKYGEHPNLKYFVGDASKMQFKEQAFDAVCSYDLLEHVTDVKNVLKEMSRVLKNKGLLIIYMPNLLDPIQHLFACIRWKSKYKYKAWEGKNRMGAFYKFIRNTFLAIGKAICINKKIYYLQPILSNDENICGEDFDASWLTNWFDVENALKKEGFQLINTQNLSDSRILRIMRKIKLPAALQSFYIKMRKSIIIIGVKKCAHK